MISWVGEFGNSFSRRKVLVTGATGFIGWHLARVLEGLGADVTGLARSVHNYALPAGVRPAAVNLIEQKQVRDAVATLRPEIIFHLAAYVTAKRDRSLLLPMMECNLLGTAYLLQAATDVVCERFVFVGSSEDPGLSAAPVPTSPYAASKFAAAATTRMFRSLYNLPTVCIRPFLTFGPRQQQTKLVPYTISTLINGGDLLLTSGMRVFDALYVEDVIMGLLLASLASEKVLGQTIDLGSGEGVSVRELVGKIQELIPSCVVPQFGALPDRQEEKPEIADTERTRSLLGWRPHWTLTDGLKQTIPWYRENVLRNIPQQ